MKLNWMQYTVAEIVLASITFIDLINEYMRLIAAIAATLTLIFAIIKFIRDERERKKRSKLMDLQIENEFNKRKKYDSSKQDIEPGS